MRPYSGETMTQDVLAKEPHARLHLRISHNIPNCARGRGIHHRGIKLGIRAVVPEVYEED